MAEFVGRARQNFRDHPSLARLEIVLPGVVASWMARAIRLFIEHSGDATSSIFRVCDDLAGALVNDRAAREVMAEVVLFSTTLDVGVVAADALRDLLDRLDALARLHPDEPALREHWAKSVINFVYDIAAADPAGARDLLDRLDALARLHPDEPALREHWARSTTNLSVDIAAADPVGARDLLDRLDALAQLHPDEPALREHWARSATNLSVDIAAADPVGARDLLDRLDALAQLHPDEPTCASNGRKPWQRSLWATSRQGDCRPPWGPITSPPNLLAT